MYEELCNKITEISGLKTETVKCWKGGKEVIGIAIGDSNVKPTVYPERFVGVPVDELAEKIVSIYRNSENDNHRDVSEALGVIRNWDDVKNKLEICIGPETEDENRIKRSFLDLEEYVRLRINEEMSMIIKNEHLGMWGVSADDIWENAKYPEHMMMSMNSMFSSLGLPIPEEEIDENCPMVVLSTKNKINGSSAIRNIELLTRLSEIMKSDLFILPSSINELIVISTKNANDDAEPLRCMVREVNETQVPPEEILSNSVYVFKNGNVSIAA